MSVRNMSQVKTEHEAGSIRVARKRFVPTAHPNMPEAAKR